MLVACFLKCWWLTAPSVGGFYLLNEMLVAFFPRILAMLDCYIRLGGALIPCHFIIIRSYFEYLSNKQQSTGGLRNSSSR